MRVALLCLACVIFSNGCMGEDNLSGFYQTHHNIGIRVSKPSIEDAHKFSNIDMSRCSETHCIEVIETSHQLGLLLIDNGDLSFGTSLSFSNGHSCTLNGIAHRIESKHWLHEDKDNNCALHIRANSDGISMDAEDDADCRRYCGARGHFEEIYFPLSSKIVHDVNQEDIECIGVYSDACKKAE